MEGTKIRLWKKTSENGKTYLTGAMSEISRLIVIENDRMDDDKSPDFYAYIVPNRGPTQVPPDLKL